MEEKSEDKIPAPGGLAGHPENATEHFPEDSHAPKSADSHSSTQVISPSPGSGQQTENMEVHKHPHHVTHKKKWAEYLLEFLMLFLAVFLGFIAENQREHFVEQKRAKEYAKNLLNDLRVDTNEIRRGIHWAEFTICAIDSLVTMASRGNITKNAPGKFYYYSTFLYRSFIIDWSRSTIDQLIQSGSLRYFKNKELIDLINRYYYSQNIINEQNH
ncbi:MAG TPA: hypothetical protein VFI06_01200, partial [Chitinophagaceae bacterium]|nr:hypothetical protein [Chitinophagaceae bacterium]